MKNITNILIVILLIFSSNLKSFSQEITEKNYLKLENKIWSFYENEMSNLSKMLKSSPEKKDSIKVVAKQLEKASLKKTSDLAIKFVNSPNGLKRLYKLRLEITKDTLLSVLNRLPTTAQKSDYGKSIMSHINSEQIKEDDSAYDFRAIDSNGKNFNISDLTGETILLLYGGLGCMQEEGRSFLKSYYNSMQSNNFKIVVFCPTSSLDELKALKNNYELDFIFVSDFKEDHSPMKIVYGIQATPTCFLIDDKGKVTLKSIGLPINKLVDLKSKIN